MTSYTETGFSASGPLTVGHYQTVWLPGTMTWLHQLITGLQKHTRNIVLCDRTDRPGRFPVDALYAFDSLPRLQQWIQQAGVKSGVLQAFPYFTGVIRKQKADLLHSHFGHIGWMGSRIAGWAGIPHVVSFYGMDLRQVPESDPVWYDRYREMFAATGRVFCEGNYMAGQITRLGCPSEKITVHPLGIDTENIPFKPRFWDGKGPVRILIAASFREKKGIPDALRAVAALSARYRMEVTIVGDASPDPASQAEKRYILDVIKENSLQDSVFLAGYQSHQELLETAFNHHLFLSPSKHASDGDSEGGAPVTLIEMSASGMMVVSTRHCDIPGVILDGKTGWLAEESRHEDLVAKLEEALNNRVAWPDMADYAGEYIKSRFDARKQAAALYEHYRDIARGGL